MSLLFLWDLGSSLHNGLSESNKENINRVSLSLTPGLNKHIRDEVQ